MVSRNQQQSRIIFENGYCGKCQRSWKSKVFKVLQKMGPTNPEDRSNHFLKIFDMGLISMRKMKWFLHSGDFEILKNLEVVNFDALAEL